MLARAAKIQQAVSAVRCIGDVASLAAPIPAAFQWHAGDEVVPSCMSWGLPDAPPSDGAPIDADVFIFTHAAGFCKELWAPVWSHLCEDALASGRPTVLLALDGRGHGDTPAGAWAGRDWPHWYPSDLHAAVAQHLPWLGKPGLHTGRITGVGHSFGSVSLMQAAGAKGALPLEGTPPPPKTPLPLDHILVIEPVVLPRTLPAADRHRPNPLQRGALARTPGFESLEAAAAYYAGKPLFASWDPWALRLYTQYLMRASKGGEGGGTPDHTLYAESTPRPAGSVTKADWEEGGAGPVVLKCDPAFEADCYVGYHEVWGALGPAAPLSCPGTILVGDGPNIFASDPKWDMPGGLPALFQGLADRWFVEGGGTGGAVPGASVVAMPGLGHFMPQEDPAVVAAEVLRTTALPSPRDR